MILSRLSHRCAAIAVATLFAVAPTSPAAGQESEPALQTSWWPGFNLESPGGGFDFHLGLIFHLDYTVFTEDEPFDGLIGEVEDELDIRRARIYGIVNAGEHVTGRFDADVSTGELRAFENYIGTRGFAWNLRFGHTKEPITLEVYSPVRYTTFAERSLIAVFAPARNLGVRTDYFERNNFTFQAGVFRESAGFDPIGEQYNYDARAVWRPLGQADARIVHVGGYFTHKDVDGILRLTSRPEFPNSPALIQLEIPADYADYAGAEFWWREGSFQVQSEFVHAWVKSEPTSDPRMYAFYVQSSWFITGERRGYANGAFRRTTPRGEVLDGAGGLGAFEIAARYSEADLADATESGAGQLGSVTLGLNWYPNRWSRLVVNWVRTAILDLDVSPTTTWGFRALLDF